MDVIREIIEKRRIAEALENAERVEAKISEIQGIVSEAVLSKELQSLENFRNKHLAHNLTRTRRELDLEELHIEHVAVEETAVPSTEAEVLSIEDLVPKYGYEHDLLEKSISVVQTLNYIVRNAGFDFDGVRDHAEKSTGDLWNNCRFDFPEARTS